VTDLETLRDDLAYMKAMASDDGRPHWLFGANFLAAGLIYGLPIYLAWATLRGFMDLPQSWTPWVSVWSTAVFIPVQLLLSWKGGAYRKGTIPQTQTSRGTLAVWGPIGLTTLVIVFIVFWSAARLHYPQMWQVWCSICFALYGSAWLGVAIATRRNIWALVALGSYLNAIGNALLIGRGPDILFGVATGLVLWLGGAGAMMLRRPRAAA
jgi:hypothetical protein